MENKKIEGTIVNAFLVGLQAKDYEIESKKGTAYSGKFLKNGEVITFRLKEDVYTRLQNIGEEFPAKFIVHFVGRENAVQLWVTEIEKIK